MLLFILTDEDLSASQNKLVKMYHQNRVDHKNCLKLRSLSKE